MNASDLFVVSFRTSGNYPNHHTILSIGVAVARKTKGAKDRESKTFYAELRPRSREYEYLHVKDASSGLRCLDDLREDPRLNPDSVNFDAGLVMKILDERGSNPFKEMERFREWVDESKKENPVLAARDAGYVEFFLQKYMSPMFVSYPFAEAPLDIDNYCDMLFRASTKIFERNMGIGDGEKHSNALDQALKDKNILRNLVSISRYSAENNMPPESRLPYKSGFRRMRIGKSFGAKNDFNRRIRKNRKRFVAS